MPSALAGLVVFLASGAVLVLEILAARLLAPYVGLTLESYTAIIGVMLAGIAAGTWLGGLLADRRPPRRLLGPLVAVGGLLSMAAVPVVRALGDTEVGTGEDQSVLLAGIAFLPPAAVLSAVTPTMVKLQLRDTATTGSVVGRLSGLGTAGAIVGTFLAGFVLVEAAPTSTTITVLGALLVVAGLLLEAYLRSRPLTAPLLAVVAAAGLGGLTWASSAECDVETAYHCARVEADPDRPSGRLLVLDTLRHSYVDLDDPAHLEFRYTNLFADVVEAQAGSGPLDVLHVGGGGFTMPRALAAERPGTRSTVLEIDGGLVELAQDELGLVLGPDLEVVVGDARLSLTEQAPSSFDVVLGDAFGGLAVPWHLTTVEAVSSVERLLRPGGLYVMNVIDEPPFRFARAEAATLQRRFAHVAVLVPSAFLAGRDGGNVVLVGSAAPLDADALEATIRRRGATELVVTGETLAAFVDGAPVLTDDHAPVDQWLRRARR